MQGITTADRNRAWLSISVFFALSVAVLTLSFGGSAEAKSTTYKAETWSSFDQVKGSKGYKISLWADPKSKTVTLTASKGNVTVSNSVKGQEVTPTVVKASFGTFGAVSLKFKAKKTKKEKMYTRCKGKRIKVSEGVYSGKFKFTGYKGFTKVNLKGLKGTVTKVPKRVCKDSNTPPISMGKTYSLSVSPPSGTWYFSASKSAKQKQASYQFWNQKTIGKIQVSEFVSATAAKGSFQTNNEATSGKITPPKPFSGSLSVTVMNYEASFTGNLKYKSILAGNVNLAQQTNNVYLSTHSG